ncbi:hypothetical protein CAL7716_085250 [Calothrix sp. PCC 7716]|nr:hypothetical protein CAL7716_085250 [Calothrix sp. PCC 7716]
MKNRSRKSISYPANWTAPKYQFGQMTTDGQILGIEYSNGNAFKHEGWFYWVLVGQGKELEMYMEDEIELLAPSQIKELIEARAAEIEILKGQLNFIG